jgi:hypothetical protein
LVAAFKAINEISQNRVMRAQELRWKKAQLARETLRELKSDAHFSDALSMLDWSGKEYEVSPGRHERVFWEDLEDALRIWEEPTGFTDKQVYIRECFDALYEGFDTFEHYLRAGLLEFEDVGFLMLYYVKRLSERTAAVQIFMREYEYELAAAFIERYQRLPAERASLRSARPG